MKKYTRGVEDGWPLHRRFLQADIPSFFSSQYQFKLPKFRE